MKNEDLKDSGREVQHVEVRTVIPIPRFVKSFVTRAYLRNMPKPHYHSRNSGLDYKA